MIKNTFKYKLFMLTNIKNPIQFFMCYFVILFFVMRIVRCRFTVMQNVDALMQTSISIFFGSFLFAISNTSIIDNRGIVFSYPLYNWYEMEMGE